MGKDPDAIRREIARTREGMADTVDALVYKSDVKSRAADKVRNLAAKPKDAVLSITNTVMGTVQEHTPDQSTIADARDTITAAPGEVATQVTTQAKRVGGVVRENPLGLALGGLAVGFVAGLLIPNTKMENERLGPISDQIKDTAKETGHDMLEQGKDVAQAALSAAQDAVKEEAPGAAKDVASTASSGVSDIRETAGVGGGSSDGMTDGGSSPYGGSSTY